MHAYTFEYLAMHIHVYIGTHSCMSAYLKHVCMQTAFMCSLIHACMYTYICMYRLMDVCTCTHTKIFAHTPIYILVQI